MILLISGGSHTGKTLLAQKMIEKYHYPCISLDLLKMGLIRSGRTELTPEDDDKMTGFLWPMVKEMIKTAIENDQHLIIEGCYVPYQWKADFDADYARHIRAVWLVMTDEYIENHFDQIKKYGSVIENRGEDSWCTREMMLRENRESYRQCRENDCDYILIEEEYKVEYSIPMSEVLEKTD